MKSLLPRSLFGRTALLLAATLLAYSLVVWQAVMWAVVVPTADLTAEILVGRAASALDAQRAGKPLPGATKFTQLAPADATAQFNGVAYGVYLRKLRTQLQLRLQTQEVVIVHTRAPAEVWVRNADTQGQWLVLSIRLARVDAPLALIAVLFATALLVLGAAALSARRLTRPLAQLAGEAAGLAEGRDFQPLADSGPDEVRSLAVALQSMSHRLAELNEQRELFLAGISHDLRSPLARMRVAVELLDARDASLAQQMAGEVEEMDHMIGQFLHYVRAGYRETPVLADLDEVVRKALAPLSGDARLDIRSHAPGERLLNVEMIRHIAFNLVHNALEHGQPPVVVTTRVVASSGNAERVQIVVQDAGPGVAPEDWPEALRPFGRLRAAPGAGHTGLGLALVDRLVRAAGGELVGENTTSGFVVTVTLGSLTAAAD